MHGVMGSSGLCGAVGISEVSMEQRGAMGSLWGVYGAGVYEIVYGVYGTLGCQR